ncbi:AAA domain-containing protein [Clostridium rectalis]|uniref:AAA domain-containing protein n=1 Tax=Clostridium rectalis TaxID=2040295 RepID=UPI0013DDC31C|nr:AAA domain-containing protein [Clostridium rectalis]
MEARDKVKRVFNYLLSVKSMNEKVINNISHYNKVYTESELCNITGCVINKNLNDDWWIKVDKRAKSLYNYLFNLYQKIDNDDKNIELIYGNGVINYTSDGENINHPVFTSQLKINFNTKDGKIYLKQMGNMNIELNFLENINSGSFNKILKLKDKVKEFNIKEEENLNKYYKEIIDGINIPIINKNRIKVNNRCMIIERRKDTSMWKEEIKNTIKEIDKGIPIPKTIEALVSENINVYEDDIWDDMRDNLLFPLPSNGEQREIGRKICDNFGVVVQGPPGTGKSHTIANLICNLLAHGKKVLVTSETDRALKVLNNKIPDEIKSLCMSVIGNDAGAFKNLEDNVRKITENLSLNPEDLEIEVTLLKKQLEDCKNYQKTLLKQLRDINYMENKTINYCGQSYKLIHIAKWLRDNEKDYSWIEDKIKPNSKAPISNEEFNQLINYVRSTNKEDKDKIRNVEAVIDKIPSYEEIADNIKIFKQLETKYNISIKQLEGWNIYDNTRFQYEKLVNIVEYAEKKIEDINSNGFSKVMLDYHRSNIIRQAIRSLLLKWNTYIKRLAVINKELNDHNLDIPENINSDKFERDFSSVYSEINKNGKVSKLFTIFHKDYEYIFRDCKIDYKPLQSLSQAITLKIYLEAKSIERNILDLWNNTMRNYENLLIDKNKSNSLLIIEEYMKCLDSISKWNEEVKNKICKVFGKIQYPMDINWYSKDSFAYIKGCADSINTVYKYKNKKAYLQSIKSLLYPIKELRVVCNAMDNFDLIKLKESFLEVDRLKNMKKEWDRIFLILFKLQNLCPNLAGKIVEGKVNKLQNWNRAWRWKEWDCMLKELENVNEDQLEEKLENEKEKEKELIKQIIYKKTWHNQILKTSESQKRSLFSWLQAVKRIGKGTGKFVPEYIKLAQKELENCKDFIPVWIMPINKVIENIKLSANNFDVVIIDESSQSNIFGISALMRAKKAIIVGDDKQISPEAIGVDQDLVKKLINMYLGDIPNSEWFDLQTSLYDTALRVFPNRVMLKEHFRCVPEIIQFSNRMCYSKEIIPLRYAYKFERFNPCIMPIKIQDGTREGGRPINLKEAEEIVDTIERCCKDKRYDNMTMGVISLLGEPQSECILKLLKERIGEREIVKRKLVCGDAYSFQGDERDVMFLSMVIADNVKFTALTKDSDIRRFNVAASRAKNQMWLFYSVDLESLSKECVRYSLLEYCLNYKNYNNKSKNVDYVFYSDFQRDVYKALKNNDFNPLPNVSIGNYKIDFIVEGVKNRAAIICEEPRENQVLSFDESYNAQLKLKQSGWEVIRIRGIKFYRDSEDTMNKVFFKLKCKRVSYTMKKYGKSNSKGLRAV